MEVKWVPCFPILVVVPVCKMYLLQIQFKGRIGRKLGGKAIFNLLISKVVARNQWKTSISQTSSSHPTSPPYHAYLSLFSGKGDTHSLKQRIEHQPAFLKKSLRNLMWSIQGWEPILEIKITLEKDALLWGQPSPLLPFLFSENILSKYKKTRGMRYERYLWCSINSLPHLDS